MLTFLVSFKVKLIVLWDCNRLFVAQKKGKGGSILWRLKHTYTYGSVCGLLQLKCLHWEPGSGTANASIPAVETTKS